MREKLKTFLLMSLVLTSLILTKQLWIELPNRVLSVKATEGQDSIPNYDLIDMIAPNKYLIHFDENNHTLFYDESKYTLWTDAREGIRSAMESKEIGLEEISKEDLSSYNRERSISFEFPEKLNTYILAKALEIEKPNSIIDTIENIDAIYIYLGSKEPFFVFSNDQKSVKLTDKDLSYIKEYREDEFKWDIISKIEDRFNIRSQEPDQEEDVFKLAKLKEKVSEIEGKQNFNYYYSMKDMVGTDRDIYIPYEMDNILPAIYMENEIVSLDEDSKRQLVEGFLNENIDYIREVVESNGSNIFIHDQMVLKLNPNGTLEYFQALDERVRKRSLYESMTRAADFLSSRTGLSNGMYLSNIEEIVDEDGSQGFELTYKYRVRGIPIILGNINYDDFVKIEVFNKHIRSYKQYRRKDMEKSLDLTIDKGKKMLHSFDVIDKNYDIFLRDYMEARPGEKLGSVEEVLSSIRDITLAYYDPCLKDRNEKLIGVWVIRTDSSLYSFDIYKGSLVNKNRIR